MPTIALPFGRLIDLDAIPLPAAPTRDETARLHCMHATVRLTSQLEALRVHTAGKEYPDRAASQEVGVWLLIGDVIQTRRELACTRSLPMANPKSMVAFTHTSEAIVAPGTVLNIGIARPKFGGWGGALQAEYVYGAPIVFRLLSNKHWHDGAAHA